MNFMVCKLHLNKADRKNLNICHLPGMSLAMLFTLQNSISLYVIYEYHIPQQDTV